MAASLYCPHCGAVNTPKETTCFACGHMLAVVSGVRADLGLQRLLRQRYRLLRQIGVGGFGAVYQAEDRQLGHRLVAVKEMSARGLSPEEAREATDGFRQEALLLARLSHPNLPRIYEQFEEEGRWYLVMDFIEGQTLDYYLAQRGGSLPVKEALQLALQMTGVLGYLHTRQPPIVFRDLKPSNVIRTPAGDVFLIDFGIARLFKPGQAKDTIAFGSPGYAAPEQYGKAQTTPRSDVFSLGALLHQLLTGVDPSDTPFRFAPLTMPRPAGLSTLIERMVDIAVEKRPATMDLVRQDLERMLQDLAPWHREEFQVARYSPSVTPALAAYSSTSPSPPSWMARNASQTTQGTPVLPPIPPKKKSRWGRWTFLGVMILVGVFLFNSCLHGNQRDSPTTDTTTYSLHTITPVSSASLVPIYALAWSPDGAELAFGGADGRLELQNIHTGQQTLVSTDMTQVNTLAWSPDGAYLASGGDGGHIQIWQANGNLEATYEVTSSNINSLSWSPDSKRIALASYAGTMQIVDALTGANSTTAVAGTEPVTEAAWSPDGRYIAFGVGDQDVHIWDSTTGKPVYDYHDETIIKVFAWSPDSRRIASAADEYGPIQVWDALTGGNLSTYPGTGDLLIGVKALGWSPDGRYLASGGTDDSVEVWTLGSPTPRYTYSSHKDTIHAVAWSSDSKRIASASDDGTVRVWDALTGDHEQIYQLP